MNGPDFNEPFVEEVARRAKADTDDAAHAWIEPDLSLLANDRGDVPTLPLDLFPPLWRTWIRATAEGAGASVDFVALALLGAVAGLTGCGVVVEANKSWREPMVLWLAAIGRPSTGKSPALAAVRKLVDEIEAEGRKDDDERRRAHLENVEVAKARADKWREDTKTALANGNQPPPRPLGSENVETFIPTQVVIGDTTLESVADVLRGNPRGVILWRDELAAWLSNMTRYTNGSDQAAWLEAWSAATLTVNRKGKPPVTVPRVAVSILGGLQPDRLQEVLRKADDGLAVRFLYVWPDVAEFVRPSQRRSGDNAAAVERLRRISDKAATIENPLILTLSAEALRLFDEFMREQHTDAQNLDGFEAGWFGKHGHVLRLAGIFALLDASESPGSPAGIISADVFRRAAGFWSAYFWPHARAALRAGGNSPHRQLDRRAALWLKGNAANRVSAEDIRRKALGQAVGAAEANNLIRRFEAMGLLRRIESPRAGPGRPAVRWEVNRALIGDQGRA